jgi:O-antigen/teichoic acid export membrane protein
VRGAPLPVIGYLLASGVGFITAGVAFRHLGVADTGRFSAVLALVAVVAGIAEAGLNATAVRELATTTDRQRVLTSLHGLRLTFFAVGMVVALAVSWGRGAEFRVGLLLMGATYAALSSQVALEAPLTVGLRLRWCTFLDVAQAVLILATTVALAAFGTRLPGFYAVQLPAALAVLVVTVLLLSRRSWARPRIDWEYWTTVLRKTGAYAVASNLWSTLLRIGPFTVAALSVPAQAGFFAAGFRFVNVIHTVPPLAIRFVLPHLSRAAANDEDRAVDGVIRLSVLIWFLGAGAAACSFGAAGPAIHALGGAEFEGGVGPLRVLGITVLTAALLSAWGTALVAAGRYRSILFSSIAATVVFAIATVALVPAHGAMGGAVALLLSELVLLAGYGWSLVQWQPALVAIAAPARRLVPIGALAAVTPLLVGLDGLWAATASGVLYLLAVAVISEVPDDLRRALDWRQPSKAVA